MRTWILTSICTLVALSPPLAFGQEEDQEEPAEAGAETEGAEVVDQPAKSGVQAQKDAAPGEVHSVVKGDTLWDLSQRYLGNPWYWPKVWSYNPEIENPHWIYPGNAVRFFPAVADEPQAATDPTEAEQPTEETDEVAESSQLPESTPEESFDSGELLSTTIQVAGPIGYKPRDPAIASFHQGFVTAREVEEAGKINGSFSEALMLSVSDLVYVKFRRRGDVRVGDSYVIFHTEAEVKHPVTGWRFGYLTKLLGTMRIIAISDQTVTAQIVNAWDPIERGDLVGPSNERLTDKVTPRPNEREMKGYVVTAMVPSLTIMGEHHVVVIDKGSADGVQAGNTFTVVRHTNEDFEFMNPALKQDKRFPAEDIAICLAVEVKERSTNCLLTRSLRDIVPGDRVEMRLPRASKPVSRR
jgi:hypothetical protein